MLDCTAPLHTMDLFMWCRSRCVFATVISVSQFASTRRCVLIWFGTNPMNRDLVWDPEVSVFRARAQNLAFRLSPGVLPWSHGGFPRSPTIHNAWFCVWADTMFCTGPAGRRCFGYASNPGLVRVFTTSVATSGPSHSPKTSSKRESCEGNGV